jgi:acid phosphatase family membrane protein YuiD
MSPLSAIERAFARESRYSHTFAQQFDNFIRKILGHNTPDVIFAENIGIHLGTTF